MAALIKFCSVEFSAVGVGVDVGVGVEFSAVALGPAVEFSAVGVEFWAVPIVTGKNLLSASNVVNVLAMGTIEK
jgi:hypothetical protein